MESEKGSLPAQADNGLFPGVLEKGTHIGLTPPLRDRGLVGYWPFDEGTGTTAYDHSGNNNTGTLTNGPTWQSGTNCKQGGCLSFDGVDDYVNAGSDSVLSNTEAITLIAWVRSNSSTQTWNTVVGKGFEKTANYSFEAYSNWIRLTIGNGTSYYTSVVYTPVLGGWFSIAGVFEKSSSSVTTLNIYINGSLLASNNYFVPLTLSDAPLGVGHSYSNGYFNGLVDDVRVYNRALSVAEILAIYNATK